jgi:1-acyl-sn-glycerol-3-phosphate acyltransferase
MRRAARAGLGSAVVRRYVRAKVRGFFRGVWLAGEAPASGAPLLVYANHPGFWDGLVLHEVATAWGRVPYGLVDERNLERFPFLARLGAFSIRPGDARSTAESFAHARALLAQPDAALIVFPQGRLTPPGPGPLTLERGAEVLARRCGVTCAPVALRYAFFDAERPDALVAVGPAHPPAPTAELVERLGALVERVEGARSVEGYRAIISGNQGAAARWAALKGRLGGRPPEHPEC